MDNPVACSAVSAEETPIPNGRRWNGFAVTGLMTAFMLLDAAMEFAAPKPVADAFVCAGWPIDLSVTLGVILLASTVLCFIPRTAILGAILLTGCLGSAVATSLRLHHPWFSHTLFPVCFGILAWGALWLRDPRIATLISLRARG
jgi:hypothetical protein